MRNFVQLKPYNPPKENRGEKMRLDFNENYNCSALVVEAIRSMNSNLINTYPEYELTRTCISQMVDLKQEELILINGIDDGIRLIYDTFTQNSDKVMIATPTFSMYRSYAEMRGVQVVEIPFDRIINEFTYPLDKFASNMQYMSILFIVNPNNPTGSTLSSNEIKQLCEQNSNTLIVVDEAYIEFTNDSCIQAIKEFNNLVVLRTFSKSYGLAGLRIGYIAANTILISKLKLYSSPYSVSAISCLAARVAIEDTEFIRNYVSETMKTKELIEKELVLLGFEVIKTKGNFILVNFGIINRYIVSRLRENNILIRNREQDIQGYSRITVVSEDIMNLFLTTLKQILAEPIILFDMDGVLINTSNSYDAAIIKTVKYYTSMNVDSYRIKSIRDNGYNNDWKVTQKLIIDYGFDVEYSDIVDTFQSIFLGERFDGTITKEVLQIDKDMLQRLYKKYRLGIVTGRPRIEAEFTLNKFDINKYFSVLVTMDDVDKDKPDPEGIFLSKEKLKAQSGYYLGDTSNDEIAAIRASIKPILVNREGTNALTIENINLLEELL